MPSYRHTIALILMFFSLGNLATAQSSDPAARARLTNSLNQVDSIILTQQYKDLLPMADSLLAQANALVGEATLDTLYAQTLHTCGRILYFNGKYDLAIVRHEESLRLNRLLYGEESVRAAVSLSNIGICHYSLKHYAKAIEYQNEALAIYQKQNNPMLPALAECFNNLGNALADSGEDETALKNYAEAIKIREHNEGKSSLRVADIYQNAAGCYISLNDLAGAINYYLYALDIYQQKPEAKPVSEANAWYNLGLCCTYTGDLEYALSYFEQALALRQKNLPAEHPLILVSLRGLALAYRRLGDMERAEYYFDNVLEVRRRILKKGDPQLVNSLLDVSVAARNTHDWKRAEKLALEGIEMVSASANPDSLLLARIVSNYGSLLLEEKNPDSALVKYNRALNLYPKNKLAETGIANCYSLLTECYILKKDLTTADSFARLAFRILDAPVKKSAAELLGSIRQLASLKMMRGQYHEADSLLGTVFTLLEIDAADTVHWGRVRAPLGLANTLIDRAKLHYQWGLSENSPGAFMDALYWGETALSYISNWENQLAVSSSRTETRKVARNAREVCAAATYHLKLLDPNNREKWLQLGFDHIESAHNSQLRDALIESHNRQVSEKIDTAMERAYQLRVQIAKTEQQIYRLKESGVDESNDTLSAAVRLLFQQKNDLDQIKLKNTFRSLVKHGAPALSDVQRLLRQGQALIEYLVTDSSMYIFWANAQGYDLIERRLDFDLDSVVNQLLGGINGLYSLPLDDPRRSDPVYGDRTLHNYIDASCLLEGKVIEPVDKFIKSDTDWLIVPDGKLQLVPFNALLRHPPKYVTDFGDYPFLTLEKNIGMAFSITLQKEMETPREAGSGASNQALILAPFFAGNPGDLTKMMADKDKSRFQFDTLPFSGQEAYSVNKTLGAAKVLYGKDATLSAFSKNAGAYRIYHFSTHAAANGRFGQYCFIVFAKQGGEYQRLFVRDIYNLQLKADLVTLSACESALGELRPGEGLLGLTYAFAYAGSKSIVSSLWQVNDASTADLMGSFYKNMTQGKMTKDKALGVALRTYLEDLNISNESKHPFFWAAFNVVGNQSPLK